MIDALTDLERVFNELTFNQLYTVRERMKYEFKIARLKFELIELVLEQRFPKELPEELSLIHI